MTQSKGRSDPADATDDRKGATILLIRHGETEWNSVGKWQGQQDSPLTQQGIHQAKALGQRLKRSHHSIRQVYSSDLTRAKRTAEIIGEVLEENSEGLEIREIDLLRERSFGIFEGRTREEVMVEFPEQYAAFQRFDLDYAVNGGESRRQVLERAMQGLERIAAENPGETVLVVSHGAVLNIVLRHMLGIPWGDADKPVGELRIRNVCLCELKRNADSRWYIYSVGDVAHTEMLPESHAEDAWEGVEPTAAGGTAVGGGGGGGGWGRVRRALGRAAGPALAWIVGWAVGYTRLWP